MPIAVQLVLTVTLKAHPVHRWICSSGPEHMMHDKASTFSINIAGNIDLALNMPHLTSAGCRQDAGIVEQPGRHNTRRATDREALKVISSWCNCKWCCLSCSDCGFCSLASRHACPTGLAGVSTKLSRTFTLADTHVEVQVIDATALQRVLQEMQVIADRQRYC